MTKRDEAVFAKAFKKMETKGYFAEVRAKAKVKPSVIKTVQRPRQTVENPVSSRGIAAKVPLAAHKK